jgi:L-fuconolactonase
MADPSPQWPSATTASFISSSAILRRAARVELPAHTPIDEFRTRLSAMVQKARFRATRKATMRFPVVDSHIHFWDQRVLSYPWLTSVPAISGPHLPQDLIEQAHGIDLKGIVFVQAAAADADWLGEAEWVTSLAQDEPRIQGIVAYAPLELGDAVRPYLDVLAKLPLVKGIRRLVQDEGAGFSVQPDFVLGVQALAEHGFSYDHGCRHIQMADAIRLAEACPDVNIVLDHFGKPPVGSGELEPWRSQLGTLADLPYVHCKLSGLATEADDDKWTREQLRPYIDVALEAFGPDRVMYGGDWPVSTLAVRYREWIEVLDWATASLGDRIQQQIFAQNAARFYNLP